jgi:signal transduction protein with GAF and PtsI domain
MKRLNSRLQRLNSLSTINSAISSSMDLRLTLKVLVDQIIIQDQADAADVLLLNPHTLMLDLRGRAGLSLPHHRAHPLRLGEPQAGIAALERRPVEIHDLAVVEHPQREALLQDGFTAYYAVPLIAKGQVKGCPGDVPPPDAGPGPRLAQVPGGVGAPGGNCN